MGTPHTFPSRDSWRGIGRSVVGWAALSPVSAREVYRGVAEVSVYVSRGRRGAGCRRSWLLAELVRRSEEIGLWTLQAGIFPENEASLALHRRCGFRVVGDSRAPRAARAGPGETSCCSRDEAIESAPLKGRNG